MAHRRAVVLALLLGSASAGEYTPAMVWTGAAPSGACKGSRVVALSSTGALYCCAAGTWGSCGGTPYSLPVAGSATLGGVKGSGAATVCSGSDKMTGWDGAGAILCGADISGGGGYVLPDATNLITGGVRLTGDFGGTATAPTVPGLALKAPINNPAFTGSMSFGDAAAETIYKTGSGVFELRQFNDTHMLFTGGRTSGVGGIDFLYATNSNRTATDRVLQIYNAGSGAELFNVFGDGGLSFAPALGTGLVKHTTATGVVSIAASGTDYSAGTASAGTGVVLSTTGTGALSTIPGTTTTVLHGNAAGAPTYGSVVDADLSGAVGVAHGGLGAAVTPAAGTIVYGSSGTAHAELAAGTAGAVLRSGGAAAPVWVAAQTCTSSAATTCTITVARSGCTPVCGMGASAAGSTWVRAAVATTTLTCTFSTSGTNICNCFCP